MFIARLHSSLGSKPSAFYARYVHILIKQGWENEHITHIKQERPGTEASFTARMLSDCKRDNSDYELCTLYSGIQESDPSAVTDHAALVTAFS